MMNSVAPFWDGNETWLVLSGGGLFAAFPLAYAVIMPALYIPIIIMLLGLIFRGVAFEFRFKASEKDRRIWDRSFHIGSILAAFMQGMIIGALVQGIEVDGRAFSGGSFDWFNLFNLMTGSSVVLGYTLLGATWVVLKTDGETQAWAKKCATYAVGLVAACLVFVSISMPIMNPDIRELWFSVPNIFYLAPIPMASLVMLIFIRRDLGTDRDFRPFLLSLSVFLTGFLGLAISLWPYLVPFEITFRKAAAAPESQSLLLVGTVILLPVILGYTGFSYYVFRGKASHEKMY